MEKKLLARKRDGGASGAWTKTGLGESVGENEKPRELPADMLASEAQSFSGTPTNGNEPKGVLLAMAWTAIETLLARNEARIFAGNGLVAVIFGDTDFSKTDGLVPTVLAEKESND